jgi:hypothetical protein
MSHPVKDIGCFNGSSGLGDRVSEGMLAKLSMTWCGRWKRDKLRG